jgi:hypothetical protein
MDDQDVAARSTRDVLADAAAEQPLEKAGFAGADDDQLGLMLFGGVDKLLRRLAGYASEVDLQVGVGEESLHPLAVLFPQLLVPLDNLTGVAGRIGVVGPQTERAGSAGRGERLWRDDTDDHHLRGEGARVIGCAPEGVFGGRRSVIADDDRLLRAACGLGPHRSKVFPHGAPFMLLREAERSCEPLSLDVGRMGFATAQGAVARLMERGFFERRQAGGETEYWVPFLYQDALDLVQGTEGIPESTPETEEEEPPETGL